MERTLRSARVLNRYFRRPLGVAGFKNLATIPIDDASQDLLNAFNQDIKAGGVVPVFRRALLFPNRVAVQDETGAYTYSGLYKAALELSKEISKQLRESRQVIAYMSNNDAVHILTQWAIWMTGNIALPLTSIHPPEMLKYYINDSHAALVICSPEHEKTLGPVAKETKRKLLITSKDKNAASESYPDDANSKEEVPGKSNKWYGENDALIIYTSGTTSNPKGVVWTHSMLATQIASLHAAWQYSANDVVLHTLPLHHVHGQLNSVNPSLLALLLDSLPISNIAVTVSRDDK